MPIYPIIKAYWKPLLLLIVIVVSMLAVRWYGISQYNAGVKSAVAETQKKLDEINDKQVAQANEASAKYQIEKTQRDKNNEVQYVEVEKIVRQPIYLSDCIDADGLREINRAAASK